MQHAMAVGQTNYLPGVNSKHSMASGEAVSSTDFGEVLPLTVAGEELPSTTFT